MTTFDKFRDKLPIGEGTGVTGAVAGVIGDTKATFGAAGVMVKVRRLRSSSEGRLDTTAAAEAAMTSAEGLLNVLVELRSTWPASDEVDSTWVEFKSVEIVCVEFKSDSCKMKKELKML